MGTHAGEGAAVRRHAGRRIDGVQLAKQVPRLGQGSGGRRIQPAQAPRIGRAPAGEFQCERCEVRMGYFGRGLRRQRRLGTLGP